MVVQFTAQQIHCVTDKHGKVVEGSEESLDNIIVSSQDITETIEAKAIIEKSNQ